MPKFLIYSNIKSKTPVKEMVNDITMADYELLTNSKSESPLFGPFSLKDENKSRTNDNIKTMSALVYDVDDARGYTINKVFDMFEKALGVESNEIIVHETHSSTADYKKFRIILPFENDIDVDTAIAAKRGLAIILDKSGFNDDPATYNPARIYYIIPKFVIDQDGDTLMVSGPKARPLSNEKVEVMARVFKGQEKKSKAPKKVFVNNNNNNNIFHKASELPIENLLSNIPVFQYVSEINGGSLWNTKNGKSKGGVVVSRKRNMVTSFHSGDELVPGRDGTQYAFPQDLIRIYPDECLKVLYGYMSQSDAEKVVNYYKKNNLKKGDQIYG